MGKGWIGFLILGVGLVIFGLTQDSVPFIGAGGVFLIIGVRFMLIDLKRSRGDGESGPKR
ncbi:MAG: hypothetical protein GF405_04680 [Candidatus Eisenbacteria bacterium]|nr:hypothetical protein [Candidatus Eisenbacteria bacterium]